MKRFFVILIAGSIGITSFQPIANSAVKAGTSCSKLKAVTTISGLKYTCMKSGSKLVWSKGVKVPATKIEPSPTPVISKPLTLDDLGNIDEDAVFMKSRSEVSKYISSGTTTGSEVKYLIGPNVESSEIDKAKNEITSSIKLWSTFFKPTNATIVWYSLKDAEWARNAWVSEGGVAGRWSGFNSCNEKWCRNGSAMQQGNKLLAEFGLEWEGTQSDFNSRPTSAHEYAHLAQMALSGTSNNASLIWWSVEGGAQFYGEAQGWSFATKRYAFPRITMHSDSVQSSQEYISTLFPGETVKTLFLKQDPEIIKKLMRSIETRVDGQSAVAFNYLIGAYATEVLVAVYGHEKMANFYKSYSVSTNSEANFKNIYGIPLEEFYVKLTPYLYKMAKFDLTL